MLLNGHQLYTKQQYVRGLECKRERQRCPKGLNKAHSSPLQFYPFLLHYSAIGNARVGYQGLPRRVACKGEKNKINSRAAFQHKHSSNVAQLGLTCSVEDSFCFAHLTNNTNQMLGYLDQSFYFIGLYIKTAA